MNAEESQTRRKRKPGAGRKPLPPGEARTQLSTRVDPKTLEAIDRLCEKIGITPGQLLDEMFSEDPRLGWAAIHAGGVFQREPAGPVLVFDRSSDCFAHWEKQTGEKPWAVSAVCVTRSAHDCRHTEPQRSTKYPAGEE